MRFLLVAALMAFGASASAQTMTIDTAKSSVKWLGKKVTGQHNGTVMIKAGTVEVQGKEIKGGSFEIDMGSIVNEDLKDAGFNKKLVDHLKSDDFFGVAKHPVSKFKITSVKPAKDTKAGTHDITGDLTIKGTTKPVTFPATVKLEGATAQAKGKLVIDRTQFDVRYGSGKFFEGLGDKLIYDTFELDLDLTAKN